MTRFRQDAVEVPITVKVEMTPALLAQAFADMSDEAQAQFFIDVAAIAATWGPDPHHQWYLVGRHLRTCSCATDESRELVATIARAINHGSDLSQSSTA